jgi:hypothetical protein
MDALNDDALREVISKCLNAAKFQLRLVSKEMRQLVDEMPFDIVRINIKPVHLASIQYHPGLQFWLDHRQYVFWNLQWTVLNDAYDGDESEGDNVLDKDLRITCMRELAEKFPGSEAVLEKYISYEMIDWDQRLLDKINHSYGIKHIAIHIEKVYDFKVVDLSRCVFTQNTATCFPNVEELYIRCISGYTKYDLPKLKKVYCDQARHGLANIKVLFADDVTFAPLP